MSNLHIKKIRKRNRKEVCWEAQWHNEIKQQAIKENHLTDWELPNDWFRHSSHIKGDLAENYAINYFIEQGKYVFKNVSQHGLADIVVLDKNGCLELYDVKTISYKQNISTTNINKKPTGTYRINSKPKSQYQEKLGVKLIYVDVEQLIVCFE